MPGIGVVIATAGSAAPYVATVAVVWIGIGILVWNSTPSPPPPPPGAPADPCQDCTGYRIKWARMDWIQKAAAFLFYVGIQVYCAAKGCGFRL